MKFAFVHAQKVSFPVSAMCRLLGVTRQGYYAHVGRPPCARVVAEVTLAEQVRQIFVESGETYGEARVFLRRATSQGPHRRKAAR